MEEEWRAVIGFEGLYEVSNIGRVRGIDRVLSDGRRWKGKILAQKRDVRSGKNHKSVRLCCGNIHLFRGVHVLMLEAFVGPCPEGMQGAHNDGVADNNVLDNLRWDTPKGNAADRVRHGTQQYGEKVHGAKLTSEQISAILRMRASGMIYDDIGREFGVTGANICYIVLGQTWSHLNVKN